MIDTIRLDELYEKRLDQAAQGGRCGKQDIQTLLVMLRFKIRDVLASSNQAWEEWRSFKRHKETLKREGWKMPLLDRQIEIRREMVRHWDKIVAAHGNSLRILLDAWEAAGATLADLYDLCSIQRLKPDKQKAVDEHAGNSLFEMVFVYNLDYPNDGKRFIEETVDAPFTHAAREYMLDVMTSTKEGREASHNALMAVFPEIMEKAMTVRENEFGEKCLYDHEGNFIGALTEGEQP